MASARSGVPAELRVVQRVVSKLVGSVGLEPTPRAKGEWLYNFTPGIPVDLGRYRYLTHRWPSAGPFTLAVQCITATGPKGEAVFKSLSLVVFRSELATAEQTPLFRIEWESDSSTEHAQPHWHVYNFLGPRIERVLYFDPESDRLRTLGESELLIESPESEPTSIELARFHFALAARWHTDEKGPLHCVPLELGYLDKWLNKCLSYVEGQLRFFEKHLGETP